MNATTDGAADLLAGLAKLAGADDLTVGKDGFNKHFGYGYMTEAALFTAARSALADAGISGTLSFEAGQHETVTMFTKEGERPGILATVTAVLVLRDQHGNHVECRAFGQGLDPADKAYYKAMTGAAKYAVQKALLIAVESDDTDSQDSGAVAGRSSGGQMTGFASEKQLGFLCALVKKGHYVESTDQTDVEHMALRLARMEGDTADAFVKISKACASSLIEKLQVIPQHRTAEVLGRLAQWEAEHGAPAGSPPAPDSPPPADDDDVPF